MTRRPCSWEHQVEEALRTRRWTPVLQTHVQTCGVCQEITIAARVVSAWAQRTPTLSRPLDPVRIWWAGQVSSNAWAERVFHAYDVIRVMLAMGMVVGVGIFLAWQGPTLWTWMESLARDWPMASWVEEAGIPQRSFTLLVSGLTLSLTAALGLLGVLRAFAWED